MRSTLTIVIGVWALMTSSASGALIEVDWVTPGDAMITRDTLTNLEWLDVTATKYISYNDMVPQLAAGQPFEGWRYASPAEFQTLLNTYAPWDANPAVYAAGLLDIMDHVGTSYTVGSPGDSFYRRATNGLFDAAYGLGRQIGGINVDMNGPSYSYVAASSLWGSSVDNYASDTGHWLVRAVPEPGMLGLLVAGGVLGLKRRRRLA